jgi:hypothetical protein
MNKKIILTVKQASDLIATLTSTIDTLSDIQEMSKEDQEKFLHNLLKAAKGNLSNVITEIDPRK